MVFDDYFTTVISISDSDDPPGHWKIYFMNPGFILNLMNTNKFPYMVKKKQKSYIV